MTLQDAFKPDYRTAAAAITGAGKPNFTTPVERGNLQVELYRPVKVDLQQPHSRDECYVVTEGSGKFEMGDQIVPYAEGDFLFVAAGVPHRFADFGDAMTCWVIFYGPEGGERDS